MLRNLFKSLRSRRVASLHDQAIKSWLRNDLAAAEGLFRQVLDANPRLTPAWSNLGQVLWEQRRFQESLTCLRRAVEFDPGSAAALVNLAVALMHGNRTAEAVEHFREAIRLDPNRPQIRANIIKPLRDLCEWEEAETQVAALADLWQQDARAAAAIPPFLSLLVAFAPEFRLAIARAQAHAVAAKVAKVPRPTRAPRPRGTRLRIGYVSADLHQHAVARAAVRLFELHDRDRFEVFAYSFDVDDGSALRRRLESAFDRFVDVRGEPFHATAQRIAHDGIDLLVDLMGYTGSSRPELFALRPAPAQVLFLGYAGTTGSDSMDYVIVDPVVAPPGDERWYSERILRLPTTYFPTDDRRPAPRTTLRRSELGLPESAFAFSSFGAHYKIERQVFAAWMGILRRTPQSVLWLSSGPGEPRLRRAAAEAGIDPARLFFMKRLPDEEDYLGRLRLADVFLDTHTYNAHSTAADALWAGLPVLTVPAAGFAGRVGASLLGAVGLPELVATDLADYEERAVRLASQPEHLRHLRAVLEGDRARLPLFDSVRFTRELEEAYNAAWLGAGGSKGPAVPG
jgi:predicted O-linked N-acetylglucosamine transferase (SPINDLY family)